MLDAKEVKVRLTRFSASVARGMVALLFCGVVITAQGAVPQRVEDRLLVKAKHGVSERAVHALLAAHGAQQQSVIKQIGVRVVHVPPARLDTILNELPS